MVDVYWTPAGSWLVLVDSVEAEAAAAAAISHLPSPITFPLTGVNKGPREMSLQHF